jgi:phospholipid/cholesterol/gamma-HCH transport system ATP-binding protein
VDAANDGRGVDAGKGKRNRRMADTNDINRGVAAMGTGGARGPSAVANAKAGGGAAPQAENFFEFRDVNKSFDDNYVLKNVSFTVKRGETCVIMGRSGVGKSVSLKHIMGFMKADSGRIFVDGVDVTDFSEQDFEEVRRKVTMVFQSGALFDSLTVAENIAFPLEKQPGLEYEDIDAYVAKLAKMLEVEEALDKLPSELSTGMKRAVAMARAFAQNPDAILFDEPTTMVDPIMSDHVGNLMLRLKTQLRLTSVVVTHDLDLMRKVADRVMFLFEGHAIYFGPVSELENSPHPHIQEFLAMDRV